MHKAIKYILIFLISINILYVLSGSLVLPFTNIDGIGIWFLKAKAFYVEHGFPYFFLHNHVYLYSHQQYPLGFPFLVSLIYVLLGGINEKFIFLIYPIIYSTILILLYFILKQIFNDLFALLFTYIFSMFSPLLAEGGRFAGQVDIFILFANVIFAYFIYNVKNVNKYLWLLVLLIMLVSQIKSEGLFLSLFLLFLPITLKNKLTAFVISFIPFIIWQVVIYLLKIPTDLYYHFYSLSFLMLRIYVIIIYFGKELVKVNNWYIFWILFVFMLPFINKANKKVKSIIVPLYLTTLLLYIVNYLFASYDTAAYVSSSFDRVLLQTLIWPFLIFAENFKQIIEYYSSPKQKFLWNNKIGKYFAKK